MSIYQVLYCFAVVYMVVIIVYQFTTLKRLANHYANYLFVSAIVSNFGYLWLVSARDLSEALVSMRVVYLGSVPLLYFTFCVIAEICKIELPGFIKGILAGGTVVVVAFTSTIGMSTVFYKSAQFVHENGYSYLIKEYGPAHTLYTFVIMGYMIASLGLAIYALFRPATVPRFMAFLLAMTEATCGAVYFGERSLGIKIELLPFAFCISIAIIIWIVTKQYLYDADRVALSIRELNQDNAVILFDKNKRYIGSNLVAKQLFDDVKNYYVEQSISNKFADKLYFENLIDLFETGSEELDAKKYEKDGKIYSIHVKRLINETVRGDRGYIIEFVDDTITQNYIIKIHDMNDELGKAADAANAASNAKSSFLANMSHEIRTPINAVLGLNSIILRDSNEESTKEYAKDIDSAGKSLLSLINDILDFSKIEAGKMDIVPVEYRLGALITDCKNIMFSRVADKNLEFIINCDEKAPSVLYGDEVRIRQIAINLLSNAVKYTEKGSVTFDIRCERIDNSNTSLVIAVMDTGMGISEENIGNLFESFKRIDEVKNRNIEGTGLGLALVQQLSSLMGGTISVESELGKGSTFTVVIPQKVLSEEPIGEMVRSEEKQRSVERMDDLADIEGSVLVVDDVAVNLKVIKMLLKKSKLEVDAVDSGFAALEKAREKKYDIIFLDHMMPVMDGIETFHKLRDEVQSLNVNTPVVMLTANAVGDIKDKYMEEGFDDYISKPVSFVALKNVIQKFLIDISA